MCGIAGMAGVVDLDALNHMSLALEHRGPDGHGEFQADNDRVAFVHRRLAILDPQGGIQPMSTPSGDYTIVYNGEVFNSPELRKELESAGIKFKTRNSDTEVLLHLFATQGIQMVRRLNGMFAFVVYDKKKRRLFGARDRMGIKPFYYAHHRRQFLFASEQKALLEVPWIGRELNLQAISDYLTYQCVPTPQSVFQEIQKLPAAHWFDFNIESGELNVESYWEPKFGTSLPCDEKDLPRFVREKFDQAVMRWSLSDVEIACSLSGGVDSSAIVATLAKSQKFGKIKTYTVGFVGGPDHLDETAIAQSVAKKWGTQHTEIRVHIDEFLDSLGDMIWSLDEPYGGDLPAWHVFERMSKDVKVGFTGTGGDELFGGYEKWRPYTDWIHKIRVIGRNIIRERHLFKDWMDHPQAFLYRLYYRENAKRERLFRPEVAEKLRPTENHWKEIWTDSPSVDPRNAVFFLDSKIQLPEEFLHIEDRFSMFRSLEARTPFLDSEWVDAMLSIPSRHRIGQTDLKGLFKAAMGDDLPSEILRGKKRGFVLPKDLWIRGPLLPQIRYFFSEPYLESQGIFRKDLMETLLNPYLAQNQDRSWQIWTVYLFQLWYERYVRGHSF